MVSPVAAGIATQVPSVRRFHVGKLATVSFGTESRVAEDESWTVVDRAELSNTVPWRTFRWYKGQRHYSGMYWSAAMRGHARPCGIRVAP